MYQKLLVEDRISRRDQVLAQGAYYAGARAIRTLHGFAPRKRRH